MLRIDSALVLAFAFVFIFHMNMQYDKTDMPKVKENENIKTQVYRYPSIHLKLVSFRSPKLQILPNHVIKILDVLGIRKNNLIKSKNRKTHRGKRGKGSRRGHRDFRDYRTKYRDYQLGVNFTNLIKIELNSNVTNVNIGCLNACSIKNKVDMLNEFFSECNLDFCILTETWLREEDDFYRVNISPSAYTFLDHVRSDGRRGGGTGFLCKTLFRPKIVNCGQTLSYEFSEYSLSVNHTHFHILIVYRPPNSNINTFLNEFDNHLGSVILTSKKLIIGGDFNIHFDEPTNNSTKKLKDIFNSYNLRNQIYFPTHSMGHTLDLLITREYDNIGVIETNSLSYISDHCLIQMKIDVSSVPFENKQISYRKLNKINIEDLKSELSNSSIILEDNSSLSVDDHVCLYNSTLQNLLDKYAPLIQKTTKIRPNSEWFTEHLGKLKISKRRLESIWMKNKSQLNFQNFKIARNQFTVECKNTKFEHYSKLFADCNGDQKQIYKLLDKISNKSKTGLYPEEENDSEIANNFGSYFENKIDNTIKSINDAIQLETLTNPIDFLSC